MNDLPGDVLFRDGTVDHDVWRESIDDNCYRLPAAFQPGDVVIDVGAHSGSVTWACARRGAKVFAIEADRENFGLLLRHTATITDSVVPIHAALWRSDQDMATLRFAKNWHTGNTGGGAVMDGGGTCDVITLALDPLLRLLGHVRFMKMDCEGAEYPILFTSSELRRIEEMAIEYHERPEYRHAIADVGPPFTVANLAWHLTDLGFATETQPKGKGMGLLFAKRGPAR